VIHYSWERKAFQPELEIDSEKYEGENQLHYLRQHYRTVLKIERLLFVGGGRFCSLIGTGSRAYC